MRLISVLKQIIHELNTPIEFSISPKPILIPIKAKRIYHHKSKTFRPRPYI